MEFEIDLSFVPDSHLRLLLEDYHRQAVASYRAESYLGAVVCCGGVLEGVLAWAILEKGTKPQIHSSPESRPASGKQILALEASVKRWKKPVEEWGLHELVQEAAYQGLIGETAQQASWALKSFRNFIHPYNLMRQRKSARADKPLATSALSAVQEIIRSLKGRVTNSRAALASSASAIDNEHAKIELNFAWLRDSVVAGCRGPQTESDLAKLYSLGIRALVRFAPSDEARVLSAQVKSSGMEELHEPVRDFTAPTLEQVGNVVKFMAKAVASGKPVAVSCGAGYGRTATLLACYLVANGVSASEAIATVQNTTGKQWEIIQQEAIIRSFEAQIKGQ